jgi:hypothetical protein
MGQAFRAPDDAADKHDDFFPALMLTKMDAISFIL